jgi:hypothetical protein
MTILKGLGKAERSVPFLSVMITEDEELIDRKGAPAGAESLVI